MKRKNERANVLPKSKRTPTQLVIQTLECEQKPQVISVEIQESDQKPIEVVFQTWQPKNKPIVVDVGVLPNK